MLLESSLSDDITECATWGWVEGVKGGKIDVPEQCLQLGVLRGKSFCMGKVKQVRGKLLRHSVCVLHLSHEAESLLKPTVWLSVICSVGCWSTVTICFTLCCPVTFLIKLCCQFAFHSVKTIPRQDWLCKESPMSPLTPWFFLRWVLQIPLIMLMHF